MAEFAMQFMEVCDNVNDWAWFASFAAFGQINGGAGGLDMSTNSSNNS